MHRISIIFLTLIKPSFKIKPFILGWLRPTLPIPSPCPHFKILRCLKPFPEEFPVLIKTKCNLKRLRRIFELSTRAFCMGWTAGWISCTRDWAWWAMEGPFLTWVSAWCALSAKSSLKSCSNCSGSSSLVNSWIGSIASEAPGKCTTSYGLEWHHRAPHKLD